MAKQTATPKDRPLKFAPQDWQNRIIGYDEVDADQLLGNEKNPRIHPFPQQEALAAALDEIGWIQDVIVNKRTDPSWGSDRGVETILDGHLRVMLAISKSGKKSVKVPVKYVDLPPDEEAFALATFDRISALAGYDTEHLDILLKEIHTDQPVIQQMLADLAQSVGLYTEQQERYSRKIDIPLYEPSGERPEIHELYDNSRTAQLVAEIEAAEGLSKAEKQFLTVAAQRHTVFNFAKIADLYAHGSPELQRLMENNALVIIDYERAIELGYAKLTQQIADMIAEENEDD